MNKLRLYCSYRRQIRQILSLFDFGEIHVEFRKEKENKLRRTFLNLMFRRLKSIVTVNKIQQIFSKD